jgi:hypothetical protein
MEGEGESVGLEISIELTGIEASGLVGSVDAPIGSVQANGEVGTVESGITVELSGVSSGASVGTVAVNQSKALTGNQAVGRVGSFGVFYWSLINDNSATNWQNIATNQTPEWDLILTE